MMAQLVKVFSPRSNFLHLPPWMAAQGRVKVIGLTMGC
jgi:hypothetical protein